MGSRAYSLIKLFVCSFIHPQATLPEFFRYYPSRRQQLAALAAFINTFIRKIPFRLVVWEEFSKEIERAVEELTHLERELEKIETRVDADVQNHTRELKWGIRQREATAGAPLADLQRTLNIIQQGEQEGERAKKDLVEANLRLVVSVAKKYLWFRG